MAYYNEYDQLVETEEERRKREEEEAKKAGTTPVATTETTVYQDGSKTLTTTQEVPAAGPVAPESTWQGQTDEFGGVDEAIKRQQAQAAQATPAPVAPVAPTAETAPAPAARTFDQQAYNANIAQQESGGRQDIKFHDINKGTAYGPYGITHAAWTDARRNNPDLPRNITESTPEQQKAAMNSFTASNTKALQSFGIEPNANTLAAAHFLGATGLRNFLTKKDEQGRPYISEAAQKANGGYEKAAAIANARLGGQGAPASGATQQPAAPAPAPAPVAPVSPEESASQQYSLASGGGAPGLRVPGMAPGAPTQPNVTSQAINAYQTVQGDMNGLMKLATNDSAPEFIRNRARDQFAELYDQQKKEKQAQDQLTKMSPREMADTMNGRNKSGLGDWLQYLLYKHVGLNDLANEKGEQLGIGHKWEGSMDADGNPGMIKYSASGRPLEGIKSDGTPMSQPELAAFSTSGSVKGVQQSGEVYKDPSGKVKGSFVLETRPGQTPVYKEVGTGRRATPTESAVLNKTGVAGTLEQQAAAQQQKLNMRLQYEPAIAAASKGASTLAEFNAMNGTNYAIAGRDAQGMPLVVDQTSGMMLMKPTAGAPAVGAAPAPAPGQTPADIQRQGKTQEAQSQAFVKFENEDILPGAAAGQTISRVRKEQIKGPDGILNNPEIAGLLQGSSSGEVGNIIRDLITGNFKDQADLSSRVASLNLNDRQKAVLYRQIGLNNQIAPLTLRANAGPGAVSDAEQKANRDANVDITRQPLYSGLSLLTKDQFMKDQQQARAEFRAQNPQFKTTSEFNSAWNAEKSKLDKQYDNIYAARAAYIAKYNPVDKNGKSTNPGAVIDAYKYYPVPEWNAETRSWDFGTEYSKKAARPKLNDFIR